MLVTFSWLIQQWSKLLVGWGNVLALPKVTFAYINSDIDGAAHLK